MTTTDASFGNTVSFISFNEKKLNFLFLIHLKIPSIFLFQKTEL